MSRWMSKDELQDEWMNECHDEDGSADKRKSLIKLNASSRWPDKNKYFGWT